MNNSNWAPNTPIYQRRTKTETACNECRRSKLKCDQTIPRTTCKRCKEKEIDCEYVGGAGSPPEVNSFTNMAQTSNQYDMTPHASSSGQPTLIHPHSIPTEITYAPVTSNIMFPSGYQTTQIPAQSSQGRMTGQLCYCSEDHLCIHHTTSIGEYMDAVAQETSQTSMPQPMPPTYQG